MDQELQQLLRELQQESAQAYNALKPLIDAIRDEPGNTLLAETLRRLILEYLAMYHPELRLLMIRILGQLSRLIGYDLVGPLIGYEGVVVVEGTAAAGAGATTGTAAGGTASAAGGTATAGTGAGAGTTAGAGTGAAAGTGTTAGAGATAGTGTTAGAGAAAPAAPSTAAGSAAIGLGDLLIAGAGALAQTLILFGAGVALPASKLGQLSIQVKSPCDERYEEFLAAFAAYQQQRGDYPANATRSITSSLLGKASGLIDKCDAYLKACADHKGGRSVRRSLRPLLEDQVADYLGRL